MIRGAVPYSSSAIVASTRLPQDDRFRVRCRPAFGISGFADRCAGFRRSFGFDISITDNCARFVLLPRRRARVVSSWLVVGFPRSLGDAASASACQLALQIPDRLDYRWLPAAPASRKERGRCP